ncbi:hypothetical protein [Myxococcus sp. CA039A]|uniref:hypothetical protein n=1 Tax=Myxococcus sp. CA039A TaxID=2741737 RepID=UPI00157A83F1|nr:hypothetical protein [Myxococcus sp. CA039A]NTX51860.1 hypothetical protein [Myxococcus sp. CA039A]
MRLGDLRKRIMKAEKTIRTHLEDHAQYSDVIRQQIEGCAACLAKVRELVGAADHETIDGVLEVIAAYRAASTETTGRDVVNKLTYLCTYLGERVADINWEK